MELVESVLFPFKTNKTVGLQTVPIITIGKGGWIRKLKVTSPDENNHVSWLRPKIPISVREPSQKRPIGDGQR